MTKVSKEETMLGKQLVSPRGLNRLFNVEFRKSGREESRYRYYIATSPKMMEDVLRLSPKEPFTE